MSGTGSSSVDPALDAEVASHFQETAQTATLATSGLSGNAGDPEDGNPEDIAQTASTHHAGASSAAAPDDEDAEPSEPEATARGKHIGAIVYFSSVSNNTARFIEACDFPAEGISVYRIPLRPKDPALQVREPYVLIVPTYGGGNIKKALLPQIKRFLNGRRNRSFIRGVISSGNRNFANAFCAAGDVIAKKCHVPFMYNFELIGTPDDQRQVRDGVRDFFADQEKQDRASL